jgi:hypothetical protein
MIITLTIVATRSIPDGLAPVVAIAACANHGVCLPCGFHPLTSSLCEAHCHTRVRVMPTYGSSMGGEFEIIQIRIPCNNLSEGETQ